MSRMNFKRAQVVIYACYRQEVKKNTSARLQGGKAGTGQEKRMTVPLSAVTQKQNNSISPGCRSTDGKFKLFQELLGT